MTTFKDDVIEHKADDIEKIQAKPGMYISYLGSRGSLHMTKELINNAIDECINENSPGSMIEIVFDEPTNTVMVMDDGRGIPPEYMEIVCTTLQSGSKFEREGGISTAGENGVGLTACNALSDEFSIIVYRYGKKHKISFENGKLLGPIETTNIKDKDKHGTTFVMKPSNFYMGECNIIVSELVSWIEKIGHLIPKGLTIRLSINRGGKEAPINKTLRNKNGLYDYVKTLTSGTKGTSDPIRLTQRMELKEDFRNKTYDRHMDLEIAFTYTLESEETHMESFCNFVSTVDHGVHADAVRTSFANFFMRQARELISERDMKKIESLKGDDVMQGLTIALALFTNYQPQFSGQTKEKLASQELSKPIQQLTTKALEEHFKNDTKGLKKIVDKIKVTALARVQTTKLKKSVIKGEITNFDEHNIKNFEPANNTGKKDYREIYIIEGDSAMGTSKNGRFDNNTQALFALKGVPLNSYGAGLDRIQGNEELKNLVRILGCKIGEQFDLSKLKYDKIIILSDSDSDGFNIKSLIAAFFLYHLPEIVKDGRLYAAIAPLYKLKSKHKTFVLNKQEFFEVYQLHVRESVKLTKPGQSTALKPSEVTDILYRNSKYLSALEKVSKHLPANALLVEFILTHRHNKDFLKLLKKYYPELSINGNTIEGIVNYKHQLIVMDDIFENTVKKLESMIEEQREFGMYFDIYEKDSKGNYTNLGTHSIGGFLMMAQKYQPGIIARFKGLGELEAVDIRATTFDPNFRLLKRLTIDDIEKDLETFEMLHGKDAEARRLLMERFELDREDLDN